MRKLPVFIPGGTETYGPTPVLGRILRRKDAAGAEKS